MRIWNPCGFVLLGLLLGLLLSFMIKNVFSEAPGFDYARVTLSTTYDSLEEVNTQLNETSQRIRALQEILSTTAKAMDEGKKE